MKKKLIILVAAMLLAIGPAVGQIIIQDGDESHHREGQTAEEVTVMVPSQGLFIDQWKIAPLGGGLLLLVGLGAAYLIGKRRGESIIKKT